ncbi:uncharacterized protein LOC143207385 [Lasioglossum baleicum]|uniref:uncharacterized protein LOC143207385 n=1 Tax=Lasioglossum baleicum TaxID=434251 RepID=UPI003FCDBC98
MQFLLVPILLSLVKTPSILFGIRVADTDVAWRHGVPEYTFNVTYLTYLEAESDAAAEKNPPQNWGTSLISKLKCRPGVQTSKLHCHFNCTKFVKLTSETYKTAVDGLLEDVNYTSLDFGDASFVISTDGIEDYTFNEKQETDESFQKLYKLITSNLYLSSKINLTDSTKRFENTTVGECPVTYTIVTKKLNNVEANKEYVITKWPDVDLEETMDVKKKVYLDECTHQQNYFTANEQIHSFIPADSDVKLESSTSRLYVTPRNFTSENVNTFKVTSTNKAAAVVTLHEHYRVQLAQVNPVKRELRTLPNLSTLASGLNVTVQKTLEI